MKTLEKRTQRVVLYFNQEELEELQKRQKNSNAPNLGIFFRALLFNTDRLVFFHRNRSQDDILEAIAHIGRHISEMSQRLNVEMPPNQQNEFLEELNNSILLLNKNIKKLLSKWLV